MSKVTKVKYLYFKDMQLRSPIILEFNVTDQATIINSITEMHFENTLTTIESDLNMIRKDKSMKRARILKMRVPLSDLEVARKILPGIYCTLSGNEKELKYVSDRLESASLKLTRTDEFEDTKA